MQSPWNDRQHHKLKNLNFIKDLRKLAFFVNISFEKLQNSREKCDKSTYEQ